MEDTPKNTDNMVVLVAEDDPDDRFLIQQAFHESGISGALHFVEDGQQLLDYLFRRARHPDAASFSWPACILLDLNMPRKNGRQALREIREDPELKGLQVVVLTTSASKEDKKFCYELGVSGYVTKPGSFGELMDFMKKIETICENMAV
ncbi:MAG: response regulator [Desulfobacterales bacterium]|nr:response regulator [Desulfobacterales bacterium]